ncbi:aminotransferase class IV [Parasediminibacterium sp. JCM 36343]|uniref:aminotransferase class IV n=1 Tax=Parasediminibacterium sp. JCM 36343 TaxID=3374279 RepID=UPI00397A2B7C
MADNYSIVNGQLHKQKEASILISDLSVQRGYGIFDFFVVVNKQPIFLEDHLDRFYNSAAIMHLDGIVQREELKELIYKLIEQNSSMPDAGIRITLTGGYSEDGYALAAPNLLITQTPFVYNMDSFTKGIKLVTYNYQRQLPQVKTIDYLQAIYLQPFIQEHGADDLLYHNQGQICECPRANFFLVTQDNEVLTASSNILWGINRKKILSFPEFNARETSITLADLDNAKEAFITSTTKFALPVLSINGKQIGDSKPGEITTAIFKKLYDLRNPC